jgi:hypothetical protein
MTIDGIATFQMIMSPNFGVFLSDFSLLAPGAAFGGFGLDLDTTESAGFAALGFVPSLSGNVTIMGELSLSEDVPFTTDAGVLVVTDFSDFDGATFTGEFPSSAVPEPTSMAIFGLGALGMAYRARRKLKA